VVLAAALAGVLGFAAEDAIPHAVFAPIHLAGEVVALRAIGPGKFHGEVVEDVAFFCAAILATAAGDGVGGGLIAHGPKHFVDAVDALLDDVIAAEPCEVVPTADHIFHVALGIVPAKIDVAFAGVVVVAAEDGLDVAELAVADAFVSVALGIGPAPHKAVHDGGALLLGFGYGGDDGACAGAIGGHRFLGENVLLGIDRRLDVQRAEAGRGGEDDDVHIAFDDFLVGIKADVNAALIDVDFAGMDFGNGLEPFLGFIGKRLADGP